MKCHPGHLTFSGIHDGDSPTCVETKRVLVGKHAMEMDSRGAGNQIYLLHRAVVMIALVRHLGMDRKDNTVVERVREMEHVPLSDTSHQKARPWRGRMGACAGDVGEVCCSGVARCSLGAAP